PEALLRRAVEATWEPRTTAALDGMVEVVRAAEEALFRRLAVPAAGLFYLDGGLACDAEPNPATYLRAMSPRARQGYADELLAAVGRFEQVRDQLGTRAKAALTARCLLTARAEAAGLG
ncbi:MAG: hypothetical protein ABIL09_08975, partial [Gemmatimonadota bacterium]